MNGFIKLFNGNYASLSLQKMVYPTIFFTKHAYVIRTYWSFRVLDLIPVDENVGDIKKSFLSRD